MNSKITHFAVGNGNCSIIELENFLIVVDLNKTSDKDSTYELLKPYFRVVDKKYVIDVLYVTHGDEDHCLGFKKFKEEIDKGNLKIGSIWHQGFDRESIHDPKKDAALPVDYIELNTEIKRRKKVSNPQFGDFQVALKAKDTNQSAFYGLTKPANIDIKVISPLSGDDEKSGYNHNDLSLIVKFTIDGLTMLYTGDASSKYWQERIIPDVLKDGYKNWAEAEYLEVGHHGSFDFFGQDRESVRDSGDNPDNYEALDKIKPNELIISAESRFPTNGDSKNDLPPHYAAWKWYHKWFRENRSIKTDDKHPKVFKYTADGDVRFEYNGSKWEHKDGWDHKKHNAQADRFTEKMKSNSLTIGNGGLIATRTHFYGK